MADSWETQQPTRLAGYESWLYQMPCIDSSGDVFVSVPLPKDEDLQAEPPNRWLIALGGVSAKGETASRLKNALATELIQLVGTTTDPASILRALTSDLADSTKDRFACLVVAVIDSYRHELTIANSGCIPPLIRRADRRVDFLAEKVSGFPLWIDPGAIYENATVPVGPGEIVVFHSGGVTAVINHQNQLFDLKSLQRAIAQAPHGAASVGQSILEAIHRFARGRRQMDDITLLCLGRAVQ
jgi:phosphoserine phosphatase RsbU/P